MIFSVQFRINNFAYHFSVSFCKTCPDFRVPDGEACNILSQVAVIILVQDFFQIITGIGFLVF